MHIAIENLAEIFVACVPLLPLRFEQPVGRVLSDGVDVSEAGIRRIATNAEYLNLLITSVVSSVILLVTIDKDVNVANSIRLGLVLIGCIVALYLYNDGAKAYCHYRPNSRRLLAFIPAALIVCKLLLTEPIVQPTQQSQPSASSPAKSAP
jgi:hypothetical protein